MARRIRRIYRVPPHGLILIPQGVAFERRLRALNRGTFFAEADSASEVLPAERPYAGLWLSAAGRQRPQNFAKKGVAGGAEGVYTFHMLLLRA
jgi:hypothetical protein